VVQTSPDPETGAWFQAPILAQIGEDVVYSSNPQNPVFPI